ncbi:hypothetical protein [Bacteroides fragilis]|uniref:hypothetical protein n=1 Tax=Bacteroides fragilis TaxID=817 RepID=UPI0024580E4C|nr:hypothetical protein [Bacteroides fragilis]WPO59300.1 hypothetical protein SGJ39_18210 [Bacteroides fragilis]
MVTYKVSFKVNGDYYGFYYHLDNIPSEHDFKILLDHAVIDHLKDLGLDTVYSDLTVSPPLQTKC